jgi:hypothetical protein
MPPYMRVINLGDRPRDPRQVRSPSIATVAYDAVNAAAVSPDGKSIYVTGMSTLADGKVDYVTIAYDVTDGRQNWLTHYDGPGGEVDDAR